MPGYGAWTPQSPIQSLHFETVLARYECPTRPDIGTMLTDHGVIVSPRGQYAALCISNLKSQISNLKSRPAGSAIIQIKANRARYNCCRFCRKDVSNGPDGNSRLWFLSNDTAETDRVARYVVGERKAGTRGEA